MSEKTKFSPIHFTNASSILGMARCILGKQGTEDSLLEAIREVKRRADRMDELYEALQAALPYVEGAYECAFPDVLQNELIIDQIRAALKKARGEK